MVEFTGEYKPCPRKHCNKDHEIRLDDNRDPYIKSGVGQEYLEKRRGKEKPSLGETLTQESPNREVFPSEIRG